MEKGQGNKFLWLFVLLAFAIGIILGLSVFWWQKSSFDQKLHTERKQYQTELEKTRRTIQELEKKIAKLESQAKKKTKSETTPSPPPNILSRSVEPETVGPGGEMTLRVELERKADKVEMEIVGEGFKKTYSLEKVSASGGQEIWKKKISAPSNPGLYRYYAYAYLGATQVSMPGVSAWSFLVD